MNVTKTVQASCVIAGLMVIAFTSSASDDRTSASGSGRLQSSDPNQSYPVGSGPWVGRSMDSGAKIKLEDGSVWEIASKDQSKTRNWMVAQKISVNEYPNDRYPFRLTNTDQKESVDARLVSRLRP